MFLRKPKSPKENNTSNSKIAVEPTKVLGSFKSTLERYHQHKTKEKALVAMKSKLAKQLFSKHKLSKTISKIILKNRI
jgi:hypothetical protein